MKPEVWQIVWFTLVMAAISTAMILPFGIGLGWLLARKSWRGKLVVEALVSLPLVIPPVATGLILLKLFGRKGPLGKFLEGNLGLEVVFTWKAVLMALAVMSFPLLVRGARVAFEEVDVRLEQVARTLGSRPWKVFFKISLPLAGRGLMAGAVLSFARALGEFGATIMVAGAIPGQTATMSVSIFNQIQLGKDAEALQLLVCSLVLSFAALLGSEWLVRRSAAR